MSGKSTRNNEWRRVYVSLVSAIVFIGVAYVSSSAIDCYSGGCALTFVAGFLAATSLATSLLFYSRARVMDAILSGENLLASWIYSDEAARKSAEREYASNREANHALFAVIGGMLVAAIVLTLLLGGEDGINTAELLLVVLVIIYVVSHVAPRLERGRALGAPKEAFIARNGVIYEGAVYPYRSFLVRRSSVEFKAGTGGNPSLVVFSFMQLVGIIPRFFDIPVPVPPEQVARAQEVVRLLGGRLPSG